MIGKIDRGVLKFAIRALIRTRFVCAWLLCCRIVWTTIDTALFDVLACQICAVLNRLHFVRCLIDWLMLNWCCFVLYRLLYSLSRYENRNIYILSGLKQCENNARQTFWFLFDGKCLFEFACEIGMFGQLVLSHLLRPLGHVGAQRALLQHQNCLVLLILFVDFGVCSHSRRFVGCTSIVDIFITVILFIIDNWIYPATSSTDICGVVWVITSWTLVYDFKSTNFK